MPTQPTDVYEKNAQSDLRDPEKAHGDASKEFITRLKSYGQLLGSVNVKTAVRRVVDGMLSTARPSGRFAVLMEAEDEEERERHRDKLTKDVEPLVTQIIAMEKRWFDNVCKAHESAEEHLGDNKRAGEAQSKLAADFVPAKSKLDTLLSQKKTVQGWSIGVAKGKALERLDKDIKRAGARTEAPKGLFGNSYFEGLRLYLRGAGFVVAPSYLPPAAVFPREDWISLGFDEPPSYGDLAKQADALMQKYRILGTPYAGVLYNTNDPKSQTACGCVCVSWILAVSVVDQDRVVVPVLGMSGGAPSRTNTVGIEAMLGACALPPYGSMQYKQKKGGFELGAFDIDALDTLKPSNQIDPVLNKYYDDIMARANNLAINYRARELLKLRLPSRQAMLSYLGLSFFVASRDQVEEYGTLVKPTPGVTRWHSLNCAEPAALAWITSFFVDGQDVHLCCPYEGMDDPGALGLKPKETCPWCATVEIAYRSLKKARGSQEEWSETFDKSMKTGTWHGEITFAEEFQERGTDMSWREDLPRNKAELALAYPKAVNSNVAVLREIFREVGILEESTIRIGRPALWQER